MSVRLRQAVLVAESLSPVVEELRSTLGLREPFADPGVAAFGLENAVFAIGEEFLEVVAPTQPGTAAGRFLDRFGPGGYMLLFQVVDWDAARERARTLGIREVWTAELDDIRAVHLHPADIGGAIVSIDQPSPPESWRWGGPDWQKRTAPGRLVGATVCNPEPVSIAERWARVLGTRVNGLTLALAEQGNIEFNSTSERPGLREIVVAVPDDVLPGRQAIEIGEATFVLARTA